MLADDLVTQVYRATRYFPDTERYGLQSQLRRAALSAATNIVEGSARRSTKDYLNFLNIDATSASETRHLVEVSQRFRLLTPTQGQQLTADYSDLVTGLQAQIRSLTKHLEP